MKLNDKIETTTNYGVLDDALLEHAKSNTFSIPIDDGTTVVTIPTPDGWKCERENCTVDYLHTHGTYEALNNKTND